MDYQELLRKYIHYISSTRRDPQLRVIETASMFLTAEEMKELDKITIENTNNCPAKGNGFCIHEHNPWLD